MGETMNKAKAIKCCRNCAHCTENCAGGCYDCAAGVFEPGALLEDEIDGQFQDGKDTNCKAWAMDPEFSEDFA